MAETDTTRIDAKLKEIAERKFYDQLFELKTFIEKHPIGRKLTLSLPGGQKGYLSRDIHHLEGFEDVKKSLVSQYHIDSAKALIEKFDSMESIFQQVEAEGAKEEPTVINNVMVNAPEVDESEPVKPEDVPF